jgi:hypothetical protein
MKNHSTIFLSSFLCLIIIKDNVVNKNTLRKNVNKLPPGYLEERNLISINPSIRWLSSWNRLEL